MVIHHYDNWIVGGAFLVIAALFLRSILDSIHPQLFATIVRLLKTLAQYSLEFALLLLKLILAIFGVNPDKKKLPGRRK